jgi:hypothetical protein
MVGERSTAASVFSGSTVCSAPSVLSAPTVFSAPAILRDWDVFLPAILA